MSKQSDHAELVDHVAQAAADFGASADLVDAAAAAVFGVNRTDLRIVGVLRDRGPMTAGDVAAAAGLSPAATTTAIQRLVVAGHVERRVDGADRRRAVVELTATAAALIDQAYAPVGRTGRAILGRYRDDDLWVILDFLRRGQRLQYQEARRIRALAPVHPDGEAADAGNETDPQNLSV